MSSSTSRGIMLMLSANLFFCVMACLVRMLDGLSSWTTTLFRFLLGIAIISLFAMSGKIRLSFVNSKGLFLRGVMGGISTAIFFYSIGRLGLVRAGFIGCLYPAFATVFGHLILGERLTLVKTGTLLGAFAGVVVLMYDPHATGSFISTVSRNDLLALFGSMLAGLTVVSIKKLQSTDSTVAIFFAQCLIGSCIVFVPASVSTMALSPGAIIALLLVGVCATAGQLLLTDSYKYLTVATGSLLVMTTPVFNCIAGLFLFHEPFTFQTGIGALVILGSSAGLLLDKG